MSCHQICPKFDRFLTAELAEMERREIEAHLTGCEVCRAEVATLVQWRKDADL